MSYGTTQTNQHSHDIKLCSDIWQSCQDIKLVFYNRELNKIIDSVARTRDDKLKEKSSKISQPLARPLKLSHFFDYF